MSARLHPGRFPTIELPAWLGLQAALITINNNRRSGVVDESRGQMTFMGIAGLMAALTVILFVSVSLGMFENHVSGREVPRFAWGIVGILAGALILVGLAVGRRFTLLGDAFVIVGAFPLAAILVWTIFLPVLWLLLAMFLVVRALRFTTSRVGNSISKTHDQSFKR